MSGRALRRLPVLALARYIGIGKVSDASGGNNVADADVWFDGIEKIVQERALQQEKLL